MSACNADRGLGVCAGEDGGGIENCLDVGLRRELWGVVNCLERVGLVKIDGKARVPGIP